VTFNDANVLVSRTGGCPTKRLRKFLKSGTTFQEIRDRLVSENELPDVPNLRVWTTAQSSSPKIVADLATRWEWWETLRFDIVPEEQQQLEASESLVIVNIVNRQYLPVSDPFWCVLRPNEPADALCGRVQTALGLDDNAFKNVTLGVSGKKNPVKAEVIALKGTLTVQELIDGQAGLTVKTPRLFAVMPFRHHSRRKEIALKISN
jgi:hypothetical protein